MCACNRNLSVPPSCTRLWVRTYKKNNRCCNCIDSENTIKRMKQNSQTVQNYMFGCFLFIRDQLTKVIDKIIEKK